MGGADGTLLPKAYARYIRARTIIRVAPHTIIKVILIALCNFFFFHNNIANDMTKITKLIIKNGVDMKMEIIMSKKKLLFEFVINLLPFYCLIN